jgi:Molybdopterin-binding domain of aldehyde dehydrogenase
VADWSDPELLELWVSTQAVDHLAHAVCEHFALQREQVMIHADHIGGAFGGKLALTTEVTAACELSRLTKVRRTHGWWTSAWNRIPNFDAGQPRRWCLRRQHRGWSCWIYVRHTPRRLRDYDVVTHAPPGTVSWPRRSTAGLSSGAKRRRYGESLTEGSILDPFAASLSRRFRAIRSCCLGCFLKWRSTVAAFHQRFPSL